ncbi:MAG: integrase [Zetaproteobacteria bacterium]|nr:MAG: integrase [Zetaproteobacteria bacterium]
MKLTDIKCKSAKPIEKPYKLADGQGMFLNVMPNGSKYWRFKYRINNKEKLLALGVYPEISLADAREKRREARKLIDGGIDPSQDRKKKKALSLESAENTFEAIAREWYEVNKSKWSERYAEGVMTRLENDVFPEIGSYPITEIEPPILLQAIRKIEKRKAHELARRQLQKCGEIFRYAIACGKCVRDPSSDIKEALKPQVKGHFAAIDCKDLPDFLAAIDRNDARLYRNTQNALRLIMLTFVRTSELINARWEEIDFEAKEWIIPAERMKMKKEHVVPLSRQAIEILKDQKEIAGEWPLVFPSSVRPAQSISNNTILGAIKRLGYQGRMTGHGFRALAMSTIKQELGYRHEVVDRQLAHAPRNKIDAAYDRALFLKERAKMMQEWADYIDGLV